MIKKAPGKINLSLNVVGLREDGYHELDMLMVPLTDLYDVLEIEPADEDSFSCNLEMNWDKGNLIYKAVELFRKTYGVEGKLHVSLEKHIPEQAGLGGGSSDAASTLQMLYEIYGIIAGREEKIALAKQLGADVPFFMFNRPSRVQGIGEKLRFIDMPEIGRVILIKPEGGISTQGAFRLLDSLDYDRGDMDVIEAAFKKGTIPELCNSLEYSAVEMLPVIEDIKEKCREAGYRNCLMSGSGSTVFVLIPAEDDASELKKAMAEAGHKVFESAIQWRSMPELETERLILRHLKKEDAAAIFDTYASDEEVTRYLTWLPHEDVTVTERLVDMWLKEYEKEDCYRYIIENKQTHELMGMIDVVRFDEKGNPVIGYVSGKKFWNHGYMTEAFEALIALLKNDGYTNIMIEALTDNIGSNRVIEKCGFRLDDTEIIEHRNVSRKINTYYLY